MIRKPFYSKTPAKQKSPHGKYKLDPLQNFFKITGDFSKDENVQSADQKFQVKTILLSSH